MWHTTCLCSSHLVVPQLLYTQQDWPPSQEPLTNWSACDSAHCKHLSQGIPRAPHAAPRTCPRSSRPLPCARCALCRAGLRLMPLTVSILHTF